MGRDGQDSTITKAAQRDAAAVVALSLIAFVFFPQTFLSVSAL